MRIPGMLTRIVALDGAGYRLAQRALISSQVGGGPGSGGGSRRRKRLQDERQVPLPELPGAVPDRRG